MAQDNEIWDFLTKRIDQGKCALIIGPEIAFSEEGHTFQEAMQQYLDAELQGKNFEFFGEDEFISFESTKDRLLTLFKIQTFFETPRASASYQKLAQIPFHLIINLSPDLYLKQAFDELGLNYDFQYYNKSKNTIPADFAHLSISKDQPLIYNLMGCIENEESLIFTYDDLFSYLENIFGNFKLPEKLRLVLKGTSSFVFIGIKFKKWYLRLLLRLLGLHSEDKLINACIDEKGIPPEATNFYTRHFEISFMDTTSHEFIESLFKKSKDILRQPSSQGSKPDRSQLLDSVRDFIADDEVEKSLEELKRHCNDEQYDRLVMMQSRFEQTRKDLNKGLISHSTASRVFNNVKDSILALAKEIAQKV